MDDGSFPHITSFIIRIIQEGSTDETGELISRGIIHHIPSGSRIVFTRWQDAIRFMEGYLPTERISEQNHPSSQIEVSKDDEVGTESDHQI